MCLTAQEKIRIRIKNKTAGHAGIACFSFALKGNRAGSPHFKIVRFKWWEHVTNKKKMNKAEKKFNKAHLNRVKEQKCDPGLIIGFSGILYNLERAADNCVSIAEEALDNTGFVQLGEDAREFAMDAVAESVALGDK